MNASRRKDIQKVIDKLANLSTELESLQSDVESILDHEVESRDNMPENLWGSGRYMDLENACNFLQNTCDNFSELMDYIGEIVVALEEASQ